MGKFIDTLYFILAAIFGGLVGIIANLRIMIKEKLLGKVVKRDVFLQDKWRTINFYKILSNIYDLINPAFYDDLMRRRIVDSANLGDNPLVLEVGCGTGYTTQGIFRSLKGNGSSIVAVDLTPEQMRRAIRKLKHTGRVEFIRGDAENLPFKARAFDAAISAGAIEYFPNPEMAISEMARVSREDSKVVIAGPEERWFNKIHIAKSLYSPPVEEVEGYYRKSGLKNVKSFLIGPDTYLGTKDYAFVVVGEVA